MAANPEIIPSDLTLEIGDHPSPDTFLRAATAFFGYVAAISRVASGGDEVPRWVVRVREGSDLLALEPATETPTDAHRLVYQRAADGYRTLVQSGIAAAGLPESALSHLNTLSELANGPRNHPRTMRIWFRKVPEVVDATIASMVREEERLGYSDYGTVEGIMDTVRDREGRLEFRVKDPVLGQVVMCHIADEQLQEAFSTFRKRVEVSGVIHYRRDGVPKSIEVESIEALPSDDDLPSPDDVRGILRLA